mmetsp:Transcript_17636/g.31098  ORF Transcript_17636/g.31098 Transcript_17636/m.31098 type:complete len:83 (-) Transcript_17636:115-363(-)
MSAEVAAKASHGTAFEKEVHGVANAVQCDAKAQIGCSIGKASGCSHATYGRKRTDDRGEHISIPVNRNGNRERTDLPNRDSL